MEKLLLFVSKDDQKIVMDAYTLDSKTYKKDAYVLKDDMLKDEDKEEKLIDILGKPMLLDLDLIQILRRANNETGNICECASGDAYGGYNDIRCTFYDARGTEAADDEAVR